MSVPFPTPLRIFKITESKQIKHQKIFGKLADYMKGRFLGGGDRREIGKSNFNMSSVFNVQFYKNIDKHGWVIFC